MNNTALPAGISFQPSPWPVVRVAILTEHSPAGRWALIEMETGASLPPHLHAGEEWILLLAGQLKIGALSLLPQQSRGYRPTPRMRPWLS